jgi:hypothetical protein
MNNPVKLSDPSGNIPFADGFWDESLRSFWEMIGWLLKEDIENYDENNTSEADVIASHFFSAYKGTFVLKLPIGTNAASYGILFIGNKVSSVNTIKHEYGHRLQWESKGMWNFTKEVALPSVTANILDRMGKLPYDYYGSPWEAEADLLGGVIRTSDNTPWPSSAYSSYWDLIKLF